MTKRQQIIEVMARALYSASVGGDVSCHADDIWHDYIDRSEAAGATPASGVE